MEGIELSFTGPFGWFAGSGAPLSAAAVSKSPGIYLWTIPTPDGELVYYVGETARSFWRRMDEHLSEQLSGRYRLYEPMAFAHGKKNELWRGVYGPGAERSVEGFVAKLPSIAAALADFVHQMRFHVAPMDTTDNLRRRTEAALAAHLYQQPGLVGSFQEAGIHYSPRLVDEEPVQVRLTWEVRPLGVPDVLEA
jgi:hypothetical protein